MKSFLDFWQQWVDRWQELRRSHFSGTNLNALIDRLATEIKEAQPRQYRRWDFQPRGGSYQSEIALMKDWLANRVDFIDSQLAEPPAWKISSNANRTLTLSAPTNATTRSFTASQSPSRTMSESSPAHAIRHAGNAVARP